MDFEQIIENGYGKLAEKLPETDKEFLKGFKHAIEELNTFKANIEGLIDQDAPTLHKIEAELSEIVVDNAIAWLEASHNEILVSFVDNNHYSIDENGNIYDNDEV